MSALNVAAALFIDDEGTVYPVTTWFDEDGDERDPEDAIVCVAGADKRWFSLKLADFESARTQ